jgi:hypothetical protein
LSIVDNARARVEANFDMRAVVPKIEDVYQRVLGNSHKKAQKNTK